MRMRQVVSLLAPAVTRSFRLAAALILATGAAERAHADLLPGTKLTEVMMDAQSGEAIFYGSQLGVDPTSPLSGVSLTDVSAQTFSFNLLPGSMYLGQAISDSVMGHFDVADNRYDLTGSGSALGLNWTLSGEVAVTVIDVSGPKWKLDSTTTWNLGGGTTVVLKDSVDIVGPGIPSPALSIRTTTLLGGGNPRVSTSMTARQER
jgi:hypothetical protein